MFIHPLLVPPEASTVSVVFIKKHSNIKSAFFSQVKSLSKDIIWNLEDSCACKRRGECVSIWAGSLTVT